MTYILKLKSLCPNINADRLSPLWRVTAYRSVHHIVQFDAPHKTALIAQFVERALSKKPARWRWRMLPILIYKLQHKVTGTRPLGKRNERN